MAWRGGERWAVKQSKAFVFVPSCNFHGSGVLDIFISFTSTCTSHTYLFSVISWSRFFPFLNLCGGSRWGDHHIVISANTPESVRQCVVGRGANHRTVCTKLFSHTCTETLKTLLLYWYSTAAGRGQILVISSPSFVLQSPLCRHVMQGPMYMEKIRSE